MDETEGGVLVFLPGEGEIRRVAAPCSDACPRKCQICTCFSGLCPSPISVPRSDRHGGGRKLVLATSIAETSLTIEDIRVVIDGGKCPPGAFRSRIGHERGWSQNRSAGQRPLSAGAVRAACAEGVCYRNWTKGAEGARPPLPPAEIESADLAAGLPWNWRFGVGSMASRF
jgi:ATP-dependent helicase HrpB